MAKYCRFLSLDFSELGSPFLRHSPHHIHCSAKSRLDEKIKKKKRCLSFFYRIILPSDLVLLKRMSYNVTEVLSLFYFTMFCKRNVSYFLHSTHKQNSTSALYGEEPPLMFSLMATLCCNTLQLLWLPSALISLHVCFSWICSFSFRFTHFNFWGHCMQSAPRMPLIDTYCMLPETQLFCHQSRWLQPRV